MENHSFFKNFSTSILEGCENGTAEASGEFTLTSAVYLVIELVIMVLLSVGNILVLVAISKFPSLRTSTNTFVVSLALSDLTVALITLPFHMLLVLVPSLKSVYVLCIFRYCVIVISSGTSAVTLLVISVDRFIAIHWPYAYQTTMTKTRSQIICGAVWVYALIFALLPFSGWNSWTHCIECTFTLVLSSSYIIVVITHMFVCIAVVGILNLKIFLTANKISKEIEQQVSSVSGAQEQTTYKKLFLRNKKAAKALALVFGAYTVSILPFAIFTGWEVHMLNKNQMLMERLPPWTDAIRISTTFLSFINSGINPIIYHRRIPEFREAFRKLLKMRTEVSDCSTDISYH